LDLVDTITDSYFLPIGGLIVVLFVGWGWKTKDALEEADFKNPAIAKFWLFLIRFVAPIMILIILLANIFGIEASINNGFNSNLYRVKAVILFQEIFMSIFRVWIFIKSFSGTFTKFAFINKVFF